MKRRITHIFDAFQFRDWLLWSYNLYIIILLWLAPQPFEYRWAWSLGHVLLILCWPFLVPGPQRGNILKLSRFLHDWLPLFLIPILYSEITLLNETYFQFDLDNILLNWDKYLGTEKFTVKLNEHGSLLLDELMHGIYFSYYFIYPLPLFIFARKDRIFFERYLTGILFVGICHYAVLVFLPAVGPVAQHSLLFPEGFLFIPLMNQIYALGEYGGAAFPSEHVATCLFLILLLREKVRTGIVTLLLFWWLLIAISTVYCSYHYFVDVLGGIGTGLLLYFLYIHLSKKPIFMASN